ncbi:MULTISPECIES: hypothetical protein [Streptomyces]|uniref:Transmembrane protein n=1 Tax=Streptomyces mutomycini TaxID=284036 RepID=A0ABW0BB03_9ACTN|nr:hypothetical protein [Streptomyces sp. NRRL S-4]KPC84689.1 hypothetical protein ADK82_01175 [Streptomyces sp. NRRL S-4]
MRSREYDQDFRDRAIRTRDWGIGLLSLAALLWAWCAVLLVTPYAVDEEPDDDYPQECESRLLTERGTANNGLNEGDYCEDERDWPEAVALLAVSLPVSIVGVGLLTVGTMSRRISSYGQTMREIDKLASRSKD